MIAHRGGRPLAPLGLAAAVLLVLAGILPAEAAARGKTLRCREAVIFQGTGVYTQTKRLMASGTSCRKARRVSLEVLSSADSSQPNSNPFGFACTRTNNGVSCRAGRRKIRWGYFGADTECGNASPEPDAPGFDITANGLGCSKARRYVRTIIRSGRFGPRRCPEGDACRFRRYRCVAMPAVDLLYRQMCFAHGKRFAFYGGS